MTPRDRQSPYSDREVDQAFFEHLRSDPEYIATRALTLAISFWFMGRAILLHDLSAGFLLLPIALELLMIFWIGLFLSWTLVDCPSFAQTARKPVFVLCWTLATAFVISMVIATEGDAVHWSRIGPGWVEGWQTAIDTGLVWAMATGLVSLVYSSVREVFEWRRDGGAFLWTSTLESGLRMTALVLGLVAVVILMATLGWLIEKLVTSNTVAWVAFVFLLGVEIGAVVIGVKVHRKVLAEQSLR